ncbi:DUF667 domain-containing protein [archaeon]|nr:MAG: DUF667 domain-containing protein [archaeon]
MPFSLISAFRHSHREVKKVGDVIEMMDKAIGRLVYRVKGAVSAQNFVEFENLLLSGHVLHIQLCRLGTGVVTLHIEVETEAGFSIRVTLSTMYEKDQPRFLGRSLR